MNTDLFKSDIQCFQVPPLVKSTLGQRDRFTEDKLSWSLGYVFLLGYVWYKHFYSSALSCFWLTEENK